ncbi:MAG: FGGY-family carbohydrate kinase [Verrucomicrobiae bacterium]|nr:FGGY-family carbohydrate kinase [Verrucomicrobiae bacterium]
MPACGVTEPGRLCMVLGPSICHLLLARERREVEGICVVEDGVLPGFWAYEAGQAAAGDILTWFTENAVPVSVHAEAERRGLSVAQWLEQLALALRPGESGLLALGWWNGNRSVLMDADLSGLLVGATLGTRPHEIFRALIEAVAFGTRKIIDAFTNAGVEINDLVTGGCLLEKCASLLQVFSDVTGRTIRVAESANAAALGAAMHAAVAAGKGAGGYGSLQEAARHMARLRPEVYRPRKAAHEIYNRLYAEYERLHDYFGRGANPVMKTLKRLRDGAV